MNIIAILMMGGEQRIHENAFSQQTILDFIFRHPFGLAGRGRTPQGSLTRQRIYSGIVIYCRAGKLRYLRANRTLNGRYRNCGIRG